MSSPMNSRLADLRIFLEPQQGASYEDLLKVALRSELLGFGALFRSDHYLKMGDVDGTPGPSDAWITLAGLARETRSIRLGTLVTAATFRHPGPLAISVAGVDQMSGGRVELGLGAGWYEAEHGAYGIPFPSLGDRFNRFAEQLAIVKGLWSTPLGKTFDHDGPVWPITQSPALPKPAQAGGPPIVIGGRGPTRTPALAAQYAAEFNLPFGDIESFALQKARVTAACNEIHRDPSTMVWSCALIVCCGSDEAEIQRRATSIGRDVDELRRNGAAGTPAEVASTLNTWFNAGADRIYLQVLDMADLEHLDLIATEVAPLLTLSSDVAR